MCCGVCAPSHRSTTAQISSPEHGSSAIAIQRTGGRAPQAVDRFDRASRVPKQNQQRAQTAAHHKKHHHHHHGFMKHLRHAVSSIAKTALGVVGEFAKNLPIVGSLVGAFL
jgi:hypothetical protein